jgi:REP element-mobilizing transposase RayT
MHDEPFALLISWTCYANWLPGDQRGYVSNTLLPGGGFDPKQNVPGTPCTADDAWTHERAQQRQSWPAARLSRALARAAAEALVAAAAERGWHILRAAVMANHVHVVITTCPDNGPAVRRVLKGVSQAALSRAVGGPRRWWTAGGSDRYKHGAAAVDQAVRYVADQEWKLAEIIDMVVYDVAQK